jgi:hypothetical protein
MGIEHVQVQQERLFWIALQQEIHGLPTDFSGIAPVIVIHIKALFDSLAQAQLGVTDERYGSVTALLQDLGNGHGSSRQHITDNPGSVLG